MKAVILAAGEGSRMRPLTYTRPKVMLPIANRPILEHLLLGIKEAGIKEFVLIVGYHDEQVRDYFGNGKKWEVSIEYSRQSAQLGTADALRMVENLIEDKFIMVNGDIIISQSDVNRLIKQNVNTMGVKEVADTRGLGVVELSEGKVIRIHEKTDRPPSRMANVGIYLFTPEIFEAISQTRKSPRGEYEITDSLQLMINKRISIGYQEIGSWLDLSYPWDLIAANESLLATINPEMLGEVEDNVVMKGPVSVGKKTLVRSGSYIVGPVIIGENCDIGPNCFIRASTSIDNNCHIGSAVEIKNSIIMKGTKVPHLSYVGDSIIGEGCNLGAGTKIANLRLDKANVITGGLDTRRRKLGAIIGDGVETGINSSINVGSMIGNNVIIGPGALAHGIIAPRSRIF